MILIEMPGLPVPFARTGGGKGTPRFTPKKQRAAMGDLKLFGSRAMAGRALFDGAVAAEFEFIWPWPKSKKKRSASAYRPSRPDVDNLMKLCCDALNGIVWTDDALVVRATISKRYGDAAKTSILVGSVE